MSERLLPKVVRCSCYVRMRATFYEIPISIGVRCTCVPVIWPKALIEWLTSSSILYDARACMGGCAPHFPRLRRCTEPSSSRIPPSHLNCSSCGLGGAVMCMHRQLWTYGGGSGRLKAVWVDDCKLRWHHSDTASHLTRTGQGWPESWVTEVRGQRGSDYRGQVANKRKRSISGGMDKGKKRFQIPITHFSMYV